MLRIKERIKTISQLVRRTYSIFTEAEAPFSAAAISFYSFLSVIPFLLLLIAVLGYFSQSFDRFFEIDIKYILGLLFEQYGAQLADFVSSVIEKSAGYGLVGAIGMFLGFSVVIIPIEWALVKIFKGNKLRSFFFKQLISFFLFFVFIAGGYLITGFATFFQALVITAKKVPLLREFWFLSSTFTIEAIFSIIPATLFTLSSYVLMSFLPFTKPSKVNIFYGALLSGVTIEMGRQIFLLYLRVFPFYDIIYGTLGFVIALMTFFYFSSSLFLAGASFAKALEGFERSKQQY